MQPQSWQVQSSPLQQSQPDSHDAQAQPAAGSGAEAAVERIANPLAAPVNNMAATINADLIIFNTLFEKLKTGKQLRSPSSSSKCLRRSVINHFNQRHRRAQRSCASREVSGFSLEVTNDPFSTKASGAKLTAKKSSSGTDLFRGSTAS